METVDSTDSRTHNSWELLFMQIPSSDLMSKSSRHLDRPNGLKGNTFSESDFEFLETDLEIEWDNLFL